VPGEIVGNLVTQDGSKFVFVVDVMKEASHDKNVIARENKRVGHIGTDDCISIR
jgi:hypothetical protein